jgi:hypothetical protein
MGVTQRSWKYHMYHQCKHFHIKASAKINFPFISQYGRFLTSISNLYLFVLLLWKVTGKEDINLKIRKRKFRWIGHTLRKEDGEIPKAALLWNPQGNRKRGRPRNSWRRLVIKEAGKSWNELRFLVANRQKWKGLIDNLCT